MSKINTAQQNGRNEIHEKYEKQKSEFEWLKGQFQPNERTFSHARGVIEYNRQLRQKMQIECTRMRELIEIYSTLIGKLDGKK